jgi:catechol 2,3-dioxygenase-like lactoylglutathione lyase family enzyme
MEPRITIIALGVEDLDRSIAFYEKGLGLPRKPGQQVFWGGYSGYFKDPDGFYWEVAHNPFL